MNDLAYADINYDSPTLWGPLLEKAWSKILINYENSRGGYSGQVIKALLGCPLRTFDFEDLVERYDPLVNFYILRYQSVREKSMYILSTADFEGDDTKLNECGVTISHSFPIIKFLNITDGEQYHQMYLSRDPRGNSSIVDYNRKWNKNDPDWNN